MLVIDRSFPDGKPLISSAKIIPTTPRRLDDPQNLLFVKRFRDHIPA
jgi:hypothetical protein